MKNIWAVVLSLLICLGSCSPKDFYAFRNQQPLLVSSSATVKISPDTNKPSGVKFPEIKEINLRPNLKAQSVKCAGPPKQIHFYAKQETLDRQPFATLLKLAEPTSEIEKTTRADPDWGLVFLILFGLFLLMLLLFAGFAAALIYVAGNLGIPAFFALLFAIVLLYKTAISITEQLNESTSPDAFEKQGWFLYFLEAQVILLALLLGVVGLAFLISLVFGISFFWTAVALVPAGFILWKLTEVVQKFVRRKIARRKYIKQKQNEFEETYNN